MERAGSGHGRDGAHGSSFAALLLRLRRAVGLTQEELAGRAGVGVRTVRDLEAGRAVRPQRSTVELLAAALELPELERARFLATARGRPAPLVNLPPVEPLVGRSEEAAGIAALLDHADLVTLIGLAGVGKSVLAITVATQLASRYPGGVGAIRVATASTEAEVLVSAVSVLAASHVDELALRLVEEPALLVIGGVDRSLPAATAAISRLRECGRIRILATSRRPMSLPGEHQWALGPLEVPPPTAAGAAVLAYPASRLFLDRLRRVRSNPVEVGEAATLGALVRRLGGLPFALELAAARGRILDLAELLARTREPDGIQGAVRAAVVGSWDLLTHTEQTCLCWLSVFQWRWSLEFAEELLGGGAGGDPVGVDMVAVVDRLVGLGLVLARTEVAAATHTRSRVTGSLRLSVFDAVRQVGLEEAARRGILSAARDQHARLFARVCAEDVAPTSEGTAAGPMVFLFADVQAALDHLGTTGDADGPAKGALAYWLASRGLTG